MNRNYNLMNIETLNLEGYYVLSVSYTHLTLPTNLWV